MGIEVSDRQTGEVVTYDGPAKVKRKGDSLTVTDRYGQNHYYSLHNVDIHEFYPVRVGLGTRIRAFLMAFRKERDEAYKRRRHPR